MIRTMLEADIPQCAEILCSVYNNEMWQCHWTTETAAAYLADYFYAGKFVGFVAEDDGKIVGAMFAHEKIWWNNSELYIDEMFIRPELQRSGHGTSLIQVAEKYVSAHKLAGLTLCTNKYAPAPHFYHKNGFEDNGAIMFMYKEIITEI